MTTRGAPTGAVLPSHDGCDYKCECVMSVLQRVKRLCTAWYDQWLNIVITLDDLPNALKGLGAMFAACKIREGKKIIERYNSLTTFHVIFPIWVWDIGQASV